MSIKNIDDMVHEGVICERCGNQLVQLFEKKLDEIKKEYKDPCSDWDQVGGAESMLFNLMPSLKR